MIFITDGQIYLTPDLFNAGIRPALNIGISVSRVGGNAQIKAMKKIAGPLKLELAMFRELEQFAKFGSDLDPATKQKLIRGFRLTEVMKQPQYSPLPVEKQITFIYCATAGFLDKISEKSVRKFELEFYTYMDNYGNDVLTKIKETKSIDSQLETELYNIVEKFVEQFRE